MIQFAIALALVGIPNPTLASVFSITNRTSTLPGITEPLANALENTVNTVLFPMGFEKNFLSAMGNANAVSTRSMSTNPITDWKTISITAQAGAALQIPKKGQAGAAPRQNALPALGLGAQSSLSVGFPAKSIISDSTFLGLPTDRVNLFGNFMALNLNNAIPKTKLQFFHLGVGGQYRWIPREDYHFLFSWEGINLNSGAQIAVFSGTYRTPLNFSSSLSGVNMSYISDVDLTVNSSVLTIPFDATTGITFFRFLSIYSGLGVDLNFGRTTLDGGVVGKVTAENAGTEVFTGTGTFDVSDKQSAPPLLNVRMLGGLQFNFWAAKLFVQAAISSPGTLGFLAGLRAAW
jgi:hypothetical protein